MCSLFVYLYIYLYQSGLQVEILFLVANKCSMSWRSAPETELLPYEECAANIRELGAHLKAVSSPASVNPVARHSLASALEQQISGRKSISDDPAVSTLCKQCHQDQDYGLAAKSQKPLEDEKYETDDQLVLHNTSSQVNTKNTNTLFCLHISCILPFSWLCLKVTVFPLLVGEKCFPVSSSINRVFQMSPNQFSWFFLGSTSGNQ